MHDDFLLHKTLEITPSKILQCSELKKWNVTLKKKVKQKWKLDYEEATAAMNEYYVEFQMRWYVKKYQGSM